MCKKILSICTAIYWFKHCKVAEAHLSWNICKMNPLQIQRQKFENSRLEILLQTFNSPVNQLLLCPQWLWCHYKWHSILDNSHVHNSILAVFFLYSIVTMHISGSIKLLISFSLHHLFCIALSSPWLGKRGLICMCCLSVRLYICMLPLLCLPIWFQRFHDVYTASSSMQLHNR